MLLFILFSDIHYVSDGRSLFLCGNQFTDFYDFFQLFVYEWLQTGRDMVLMIPVILKLHMDFCIKTKDIMELKLTDTYYQNHHKINVNSYQLTQSHYTL